MFELPSWLRPRSPNTSDAVPGRLALSSSFSWQNPAWSPDGRTLSLTRFERYNEGASAAYTYVIGGELTEIASDAITQPGSCWHLNGGIIMSRTVPTGEDNIWSWEPRAGLLRLLKIPGHVLSEPSWAPDGRTFCFEAHKLDVDVVGHGRIGIARGATVEWITPEWQECRQPNWDWKSNYIVYQRSMNLGGDDWQLFIQSPTASAVPLSIGAGTDATWTAQGHILASRDDGLVAINVDTCEALRSRSLQASAYAGAPSMSPDEKWIAFEAADCDPDGGPGTYIVIRPM